LNSGGQIGQLKFRGEYHLLTLKQAGPALYRRYFEGSAVEYVFLAFLQMLRGIRTLLFGRLFLKTRDQNAEV
jgi:hypothetical protein